MSVELTILICQQFDSNMDVSIELLTPYIMVGVSLLSLVVTMMCCRTSHKQEHVTEEGSKSEVYGTSANAGTQRDPDGVSQRHDTSSTPLQLSTDGWLQESSGEQTLERNGVSVIDFAAPLQHQLGIEESEHVCGAAGKQPLVQPGPSNLSDSQENDGVSEGTSRSGSPKHSHSSSSGSSDNVRGLRDLHRE
jgi:hypothetical protein